MMLIYILIIFFTILLLYQAFLAIFKPISLVEGLENKSESKSSGEYEAYNTNDPNNALILAQQNAGNIYVLKGKIDGLDGIKEQVDNMKINMDSMQTQIDGLVQQQADYAQEMAGSEPVEVTGTEEETAEDVEEEIENS
jgi:hypothetical protein